MFFDLLDSICKENGTTVTAVLVAVGLSKGSIRNWKNGVLPKYQTRLKIANYLGVPVERLMTEQEIEEEKKQHEQIEKLKAGAFLDELLVSEKGAKFFAEVDTELNRLAIAEATYVRAPKTLHGSILTPEQSNAIMSGKSMEYERENPNDKSQVFVLKARYSPIYYTIRSESVLDKDGKPLVRSVSVSVDPSQTLQSVEEAVKMSAQKTKKRVSQQRQM